MSKPVNDQEVVAKRLSSEICKAFPKDESVGPQKSCCHMTACPVWLCTLLAVYMQKMLVTIRKDDTLIFGGSSEPAALAQLYYAAGGVYIQVGLLTKAQASKHIVLQALALTST